MRAILGCCALSLLLGASGCGLLFPAEETSPTPFSLKFAPAYEGAVKGCGDRLSGFGPSGAAEISISDLRFYVSDLRFFDEAGNEVAVELDENEFQYSDANGKVALIDLTGTLSGACAGDGLSGAEGTARANDTISGMRTGQVRRISFSVGVPQRLMKATLTSHTAEDAPSPLREMHWSWAFGYRHLVFNFTLLDNGVAGEGYVHVGSTGCGGDGVRALSDLDECAKLNTPVVSLENFDLENDTVVIDLGALLKDLDFQVVAAGDGAQVVPGVACHSSAAQPDCDLIFTNLGIDMDSGDSVMVNTAFSKMRR